MQMECFGMIAKTFSSINRAISLLLAIFVLIAGGYSGHFAEFFPSLCTLTEQADCYVQSSDVAFSDAKSFTTEVLNGNMSACIQQILGRTNGQNREIRYIAEISYLDIISIISCNFFTAFKIVHSDDLHQEESVSNYIHRTDGKKRF